MKTTGPECVLAHPESTNNEHEIITARKRSLGQGNMFTGVCLSTGWMPGAGGAWSRGCLLWEGGLVQGGAWSGGVPGGDPPTGAAAGGTHPTGMHSCIQTCWPLLKLASHF